MFRTFTNDNVTLAVLGIIETKITIYIAIPLDETASPTSSRLDLTCLQLFVKSHFPLFATSQL